MRNFVVILGATLLLSTPVAAQNRQRQQQMQGQQLREQVAQRFLNMFVETAGLDQAQKERFAEEMNSSFQWGAQHSAQQRQRWQALEAQMRPGVAADVDSINALMSALTRAKIEEGEHDAAQLASLSEFLSPVQVAQFMIHTERFQRQVESIRGRRGRMQGNGGGF